MSDYISQTITVSSCQSDISNRCRIKTPCITGMAEKSHATLGGGGVGFGFGGHPARDPTVSLKAWGAEKIFPRSYLSPLGISGAWGPPMPPFAHPGYLVPPPPPPV